MIKRYIFFAILSLVLVLFMLFDILSQDNSIKNSQLKFTKLTTIIEPFFSVSFLEDRFLILRDSINRVYPTMPKIDKKEFVYAK